jgi:starch phosphorylase
MKKNVSELRDHYGCGPLKFSGAEDALYERHLIFDRVLDPKAADVSDRFEAAARSLRDVVSQRWLRTERTYEQMNPKRVYYLSMEFLLGRSLANNVLNALLEPLALTAAESRGLDWLGLLEGEPDATSNRLEAPAACPSSRRPWVPGMGYGSATNTGS